MLPRQFKILIEMLRSELRAFQEIERQKVQATRESQKSANAHWSELPGIVASVQRPTHNQITEAQARHDQDYRQTDGAIAIQRGLRLPTWCACAAATATALGAFIYAHIAAQQACIMQRTYKDIHQQTAAFQDQVRPWVTLARDDGVTLATDAAGSQVSFTADGEHGNVILDYSLVNVGHSAAMVWIKGKIVPKTTVGSSLNGAKEAEEQCNVAVSNELRWSVIPGVPMNYRIYYDGGNERDGSSTCQSPRSALATLPLPI